MLEEEKSETEHNKEEEEEKKEEMKKTEAIEKVKQPNVAQIIIRQKKQWTQTSK